MLCKVPGVRSDSQGLVVAKTAIIVELDGPPTFLILTRPWSINDLVADNLDLVRFWSNEVHEKGVDDRHHARGEDNHRDSMSPRPVEEILEVGIKCDVLTENFDAFRKGRFDAIYHVLKGITLIDKDAVIAPDGFQRLTGSRLYLPEHQDSAAFAVSDRSQDCQSARWIRLSGLKTTPNTKYQVIVAYEAESVEESAAYESTRQLTYYLAR